MKKLSIILFLAFLGSTTYAQSIINRSHKNSAGEKVVRFEVVLPTDIKTAWQLFTVDSMLQRWVAPVAHMELRTGGYMVTNYDKTKTIDDSSSIHLPVVSFIDRELLIFKVELNGAFVESVRESDGNLQEIIQFRKVDEKNTKIISSMVGFGQGEDWEKTYNFFIKGNEWTYNELLKHYQ